jgi:hypothetical protein
MKVFKYAITIIVKQFFDRKHAKRIITHFEAPCQQRSNIYEEGEWGNRPLF